MSIMHKNVMRHDIGSLGICVSFERKYPQPASICCTFEILYGLPARFCPVHRLRFNLHRNPVFGNWPWIDIISNVLSSDLPAAMLTQDLLVNAVDECHWSRMVGLQSIRWIALEIRKKRKEGSVLDRKLSGPVYEGRYPVSIDLNKIF